MSNGIRIKYLIVVAGPSASGKHSLVQSLKECGGLVPGLEHEDFSNYSHLRTDLLPWVEEREMEKASLHFDIIHAYDDPKAWQQVSGILANAKSALVITLACQRRTLLRRLVWRMLTIFSRDPRWMAHSRKKRFLDLWSKRKLYTGPDRLMARYDKWEKLVAPHSGTAHLLLDTDVRHGTFPKPVPYDRELLRQTLYPHESIHVAEEKDPENFSPC